MEAVKKLRTERLEKGLCVECGKHQKLPDKLRCAFCTKKIKQQDRDRRFKKIESGICSVRHCKNPISSNTFCEFHRGQKNENQKQRRRELLELKLCAGCAKNEAVGTMCVVCHLKKAAKRYLGDLNQWNLLEDLFNEQNRICVYSGLPLYIGENASLDHVVAKSKGGLNEIGNFQWVHIWINKMKNDLPHDEFITLLNDFAPKLSEYRLRCQAASTANSTSDSLSTC